MPISVEHGATITSPFPIRTGYIAVDAPTEPPSLAGWKEAATLKQFAPEPLAFLGQVTPDLAKSCIRT